MQTESTEETTTTEPTIEEQAEAGNLGLFTEETEDKEAPDGVQRQKEGEGKEEVDSPRLSQVMEEIARRDREVFQKTQALKERESQLEQYSQLQGLAGKDPDKVLKAFGIDPAQYVYQKYLSGEEEDKAEVREPDPEVAQLKRQVHALTSQNQEKEYSQAYNNGVDSLRYQAEQLSEDLPLAAKALSSGGGNVLANQMIEAANMRYKEYGQIPTTQDLVSNVEPLLLDQALGVIRDLWSVEKYRDQVMDIIGQKTRPTSAARPAGRSTTLSAKMAGEKAAPNARPMSDEERESEFLRLMRKEGWSEDTDE